MSSTLFTSPAYLEALERSGCVGPDTGWTPAHLYAGGSVAAPCYLKTHSWGEFVFDFELARSYAQHGLAYYPKLVCCVPYTPVPGPRLLATGDEGRRRTAEALTGSVRERGLSGAHVLYAPEDEIALLETAGWMRREQLRYLWHNRDYTDFDAFLDALSARRRKNIRRERRLVAATGLEIEWRTGGSIAAGEWPAIFELYAGTYRMRGQPPYLTLACLRDWAAALPDRMLFCLAHRGGALAAMAFFFRDGDTLYGRHWGAAADVELLHFELCYYQGIDYAIRHKLRCFDAGVQGEHKLLRGFDPARAYSAHWFAHRGFHEAIARHFADERHMLDTRFGALQEHSAYRTGEPPQTQSGDALSCRSGS